MIEYLNESDQVRGDAAEGGKLLLDHWATWVAMLLFAITLSTLIGLWWLKLPRRKRDRPDFKERDDRPEPPESREDRHMAWDVLDHVDVAVAVLEGMDEHLILSRAAGGLWRRLGYDPAELAGRPLGKVLPEKTYQAVLCASREAFGGRDGLETRTNMAGYGLILNFFPIRREGRIPHVLLIVRSGTVRPLEFLMADEQDGAWAVVETSPHEAEEQEVQRMTEQSLQEAKHGRAIRSSGSALDHTLETLEQAIGQAVALLDRTSADGAPVEDPVWLERVVRLRSAWAQLDQRLSGPDLTSTESGELTVFSTVQREAQNAAQMEALRVRVESLSMLTQREKEVLLQIGLGKRNKEIAEALFISEHTVKNHISNILSKLGVTDRVQLLSYIYRRSSGETEKSTLADEDKDV